MSLLLSLTKDLTIRVPHQNKLQGWLWVMYHHLRTKINRIFASNTTNTQNSLSHFYTLSRFGTLWNRKSWITPTLHNSTTASDVFLFSATTRTFLRKDWKCWITAGFSPHSFDLRVRPLRTGMKKNLSPSDKVRHKNYFLEALEHKGPGRWRSGSWLSHSWGVTRPTPRLQLNDLQKLPIGWNIAGIQQAKKRHLFM